MSFFGFDPALPKKGKRDVADEDSALDEKIERMLAASAQEDVEVYTWGQDAYDGLGDQLQETNDDFNEDTFGALAQKDIGTDFAFSTQETSSKNDRNASAFAVSFDEFWSTPNLMTGASSGATPGEAPMQSAGDVDSDMRSRQMLSGPSPASHAQQAPMPKPTSTPTPSRPMTLEEVEAELRAKRSATPSTSASLPHTNPGLQPQPSSSPLPAVPHPTTQEPARHSMSAVAAAGIPPQSTPANMPGMPPIPLAPSRSTQLPSRPRSPVPQRQPAQDPQAAHLARLRSMLEACPKPVQECILSLPPPIQFESLEEIAARFPALLHPNVPSSEEQAAIQVLLSTAPARMQQWQAAEEKRRAKAAKIANITRYNGLMSGSDKDFITRIQISHLVTPDPYADDFYAHVFFAVRGGGRKVVLPTPASNGVNSPNASGNPTDDKKPVKRRLTRHENAMLRMQQQVERLVENRKKREAKGSVASLSGTLGRVSLSSANKPRQILQVINNTTPVSEQDKSKSETSGAEDAMRVALQGASLDDASLRAHDAQKHQALTRRESLVILERLYAIVLRLEQLRREPALDNDADVLREQTQLSETLWNELRVLDPLEVSDPHPFVSLLNHVKGKRLLPRALRLLDAEQGLTTLTMLIALFSSLDAVRDYSNFEQYQASDALPHVARARLNASQAAEIGRSIEAFGNSVLFNMISLINQAPLRIISGMLALLMERNDIVSVSKTRPGISILTVLLSRAETLRQKASNPVGLEDDAPTADEIEQWSNVFGVLLDRLAANGMLSQLFPSTRIQATLPFGVDLYLAHAARNPRTRFDLDAEDEPVWNAMALFAIHSDLNQQQRLVQELREKILSTIIAAKEAKSKGSQLEESVRIHNVNLLLHALNLDAAQISL
ncbi:DNA topoisomerase 2-associated protein pat1 [Malassezia psittaci]|uniref:DNA topoisomerase 2-associated protein pat1 n=1 Tax=Malassezia psittaci TaxID=1821823 RepID=A0AAF0FCQ2_9BASI|nr:DNA topoisomerase 2-associated protein pat1 [Malassezia psittaci]